MIGQTKKPLQEILEFLEGKQMAIEWEDAVPVIAEKAGLLPRPEAYTM